MSGDRQSEEEQLEGGMRKGGRLGAGTEHIQGKMQRGKQVAETLG